MQGKPDFGLSEEQRSAIDKQLENTTVQNFIASKVGLLTEPKRRSHYNHRIGIGLGETITIDPSDFSYLALERSLADIIPQTLTNIYKKYGDNALRYVCFRSLHTANMFRAERLHDPNEGPLTQETHQAVLEQTLKEVEDIFANTESKKEGRPTSAMEQVAKAFIRAEFIAYSEKHFEDMSVNVPSTGAIRNKFFDAIALNTPSSNLDGTDERKSAGPQLDMLNNQQFIDALTNYYQLTDLTRMAVAQTMKAVAGYGYLETGVVENLREEVTGEEHDGHGNLSDSDAEDRPPHEKKKGHIILLRECIDTVAELLGVNPPNLNADNPCISSSTRDSRKSLGKLYAGTLVDGKGTTESPLDTQKPAVRSSIMATSAAHESKAPWMLTRWLEGITCILNRKGIITDPSKDMYDTEKMPKIRKYFEEHLGKEAVDSILSGTLLSSETEVTHAMKAVRGKTSAQLRDEGLVEQAHRRDALNAVRYLVTLSPPNNHSQFYSLKEMFVNLVHATGHFKKLLGGQEQFYNGLYDHLMAQQRQEELSAQPAPVRTRSTPPLSPEQRLQPFDHQKPPNTHARRRSEGAVPITTRGTVLFRHRQRPEEGQDETKATATPTTAYSVPGTPAHPPRKNLSALEDFSLNSGVNDMMEVVNISFTTKGTPPKVMPGRQHEPRSPQQPSSQGSTIYTDMVKRGGEQGAGKESPPL